MTYFNKQGASYYPTPEAAIHITKELPPGTYVANYNIKTGYYLTEADNFSISGKIYGDVEKRVNRVKNTFYDRPNSTGIILSGEKGSGKTMLVKMLSNSLREDGVITIIISQMFCGVEFNEFISAITQPAIVIFDEFEKVYREKDQQEALLTLFDGVFTTKKLFAVTTNDKYGISRYMTNRPGRMYYSFDYEGLDVNFINEYVTDNLNNKDSIDLVVKYLSSLHTVNFDMMKAIIEEMNRYDEPVNESVIYLNIADDNTSLQYTVKKIEIIGKPPHPKFVKWADDKVNSGGGATPLTNRIYLEYDFTNDDGEEEEEYLYLLPSDIKKMSGSDFIYATEDVVVTITKVVNKKLDYWNFIKNNEF